MLGYDDALERITTTRVDRGLYLLRYGSGPVAGPIPVAIVSPAVGSEPFIDVISTPGVTPGLLSRPGEILVVRAERSGDLSIKLSRRSVEAAFDASFKIELISAAIPTAPHAGANPAVEAFADNSLGLRIRAHVARRGDVEVGDAEWVAGPNAPAAIEGLEVCGVLPAGLQIEMQVLIAASRPCWLDWTAPNVFCGTRGRATPLLGVRFRLVGPASASFVINAEALFLGSPLVACRGVNVELLSPSGVDPLVGLKLGLSLLVPAHVDVDDRYSGATAPYALQECKAQSRVRIYRAL